MALGVMPREYMWHLVHLSTSNVMCLRSVKSLRREPPRQLVHLASLPRVTQSERDGGVSGMMRKSRDRVIDPQYTRSCSETKPGGSTIQEQLGVYGVVVGAIPTIYF